MSESFDPYHVWLGIPPESRPPTHYELLGISPNEQEKAVIEAAVLRQSGYVRNFQIGTYGKDAARILNEIGAAKGCLLDPAKRAKYDADLKARRPAPIQTHSQASSAAIALAPVPPPTVDLDPLAATAVPPALRPVPHRRPTALTLKPHRRKPPNIAWQLSGGVGISVCILLAAVAFWPKSVQEPPQTQPDAIGTVVRAASIELDRAATEPPAVQRQPEAESARSEPPPPTVSPPVSVAAKAVAPRDRATDWTYGYAKTEGDTLGDFMPFTCFMDSMWCESAAYPDPRLDWAMLDAQGGHPGTRYAVIRRWVSPAAGVVSMAGTLAHKKDEALTDGIRGRVIAGRGETKGEWRVRTDTAVTKVARFRVGASDECRFCRRLLDAEGIRHL